VILDSSGSLGHPLLGNLQTGAHFLKVEQDAKVQAHIQAKAQEHFLLALVLTANLKMNGILLPDDEPFPGAFPWRDGLCNSTSIVWAPREKEIISLLIRP